MNTPPLKGCSKGFNAFTLIELLVVITIIAVLAGLLLPVVQKVLQNAKKVTAKTAETQIIAAVNAFQTEYGQYPIPPTTGTTTTTPTAMDTTYGIDNNTHNSALFNILRNLESGTPVANTRHIVYFESKNVKNVTNPLDGFIPSGSSPNGNPMASPVVSLTAGDLVDPWGNMYAVRIDTGYSNAVVNPYSEGNSMPTATADDSSVSDRTSATLLLTGVVCWSPGYDGALNTVATPFTPTPGDDVVSWQ